MQYEGSGDVFFAFYNGAQQLTEMPKKGAGLGFERADCTKGASVLWNNNLWAPIVVNIKESKTKCTLYFSANASNYSNVEEIMKSNYTQVAYDDTGDWNLRYIGATPNNYIDIGDKETNGNKILWQIIGVMNNMTVINEDGSESTGQSLVKIIRADKIGRYSWDSSASGVNDGYGVNEWSQADSMTALNEGAYWNKTSGECYNDKNDVKTTCDFSSTGLTQSVKDKLVKVRWNTGTMEEAYHYTIYGSNEKFNTKAFYKAERSNHNGKELCVNSGKSSCNDSVGRTTTWDGYIGLMYPSDYGYAVGGDGRINCLEVTLNKWSDSYYNNCKANDWLYISGEVQYTLTPVPDTSDANGVFGVTSFGKVESERIYDDSNIRPVVYLSNYSQIVAGEGTKENPYTLK